MSARVLVYMMATGLVGEGHDVKLYVDKEDGLWMVELDGDCKSGQDDEPEMVVGLHLLAAVLS